MSASNSIERHILYNSHPPPPPGSPSRGWERGLEEEEGLEEIEGAVDHRRHRVPDPTPWGGGGMRMSVRREDQIRFLAGRRTLGGGARLPPPEGS